MSIMNPVELRRRGFQALVAGLGYVDALRFMMQYETGPPGADYTKERHALLDHLSADQIMQMARDLGGKPST